MIDRDEAIRPASSDGGSLSLISAIDHVAIAVKDLQAAVDWYERALGFHVVERRHTTGHSTGMLSAVMQAGAAVVVLVQGTEPTSQVNRFIDRFGEGVQHVAFAVDNIELVLEQLDRAGALSETGILEDVGIRQTFLRREPGSGVRVELIERSGGVFSDDSVEGLFKRMEERGLY